MDKPGSDVVQDSQRRITVASDTLPDGLLVRLEGRPLATYSVLAVWSDSTVTVWRCHGPAKDNPMRLDVAVGSVSPLPRAEQPQRLRGTAGLRKVPVQDSAEPVVQKAFGYLVYKKCYKASCHCMKGGVLHGPYRYKSRRRHADTMPRVDAAAHRRAVRATYMGKG